MERGYAKDPIGGIQGESLIDIVNRVYRPALIDHHTFGSSRGPGRKNYVSEIIRGRGTLSRRLRGKGGAGYGDGQAGNALVTLTVQSHPIFRREGNDIVVVLPITIDEAVLGGKVKVPTIEGVVKLSIPKGASSGQVLRMRGRGVKAVGGEARGDQRVELKIVMPAVMDAELAEFFEEWRKGHAYDPRKGMMK